MSKQMKKKTGPFTVSRATINWCPAIYFNEDGEAFTLPPRYDKAEELVKWLNYLWAKKGDK